MKLVKSVETQRQFITRVFNFMRDEIRFTLDPPKPCKEVLETKSGNCFNKASLQIAILRAANIPARYRTDLIDLRTLKPFVPESIYLNDLLRGREMVVGTHFAGEAYLDEWVCCDFRTITRQFFTKRK